MNDRWTIFVEGNSDKRFLQYLMKHINLTNVDIEVIGGGVSHLSTVEPTVRRNHDKGNQIAILLDADKNPIKRRTQFQTQRNMLHLPIENNDCF